MYMVLNCCISFWLGSFFMSWSISSAMCFGRMESSRRSCRGRRRTHIWSTFMGNTIIHFSFWAWDVLMDITLMAVCGAGGRMWLAYLSINTWSRGSLTYLKHLLRKISSPVPWQHEGKLLFFNDVCNMLTLAQGWLWLKILSFNHGWPYANVAFLSSPFCKVVRHLSALTVRLLGYFMVEH